MEAAFPAAAAVAGSKVMRVKLRKLYLDHYNEAVVKNAVLNELQQIREDTKALRDNPFATACSYMKLWQQSPDGIESRVNIGRLEEVSKNAAKGFSLVEDPLDKVAAAALHIYADYHLVAFSKKPKEGNPSWISGKREAQRMLQHYIESLPQLEKAAREEMAKIPFGGILHRGKRRKMLVAFTNLSASVFELPPACANNEHPQYDALQEAVLHACQHGQNSMLPARIRHLITKPQFHGKIHGNNINNCCDVFDNGTKVVTGRYFGDNPTLKVWDLSTGKLIRTLSGHSGSVNCCKVFDNDSKVVSVSDDSAIKVWDLATGKCINTFPELRWSGNGYYEKTGPPLT